LPNSYNYRAERSEHQSASEPREPLICYDLLTSEFVLLILAFLAAFLCCTERFIKYDRSLFCVEGVGLVILFLVGQGAVYPLCKRL